MSQKFNALAPEHRDFIARQKIFFVASAAQEGRVNVSPKGMASFAVLGDNRVAYLDCTGSGEYGALLPHFEEMPGARQIVRLDVDLVQTSCGMAVPFFDYRAERENLVRHWTRQGFEGLRKYWTKKNMSSIDGLPTDLAPEAMLPRQAAE